MSLSYTTMDSPIGPLRLVATDRGVRRIILPGGEQDACRLIEETVGGQPEASLKTLSALVTQLREYFSRLRRTFDLPLDMEGTPFQRAVWAELLQIPYGATVSYGGIARRLGRGTGAARAVGLALGKNPIPIVVPCHRVIGADGSLTGYGGGLEAKAALLQLEQVTQSPSNPVTQ